MKTRAGLLSICLQLFLAAGCVSVRDVSSQPPYSEVVGKRFVLQQDCYIFRFYENMARIKVGIAPHGSGQFLPVRVSQEFVHKRLKNVEILGIMPKGAILTVVGCTEEREPENTWWRFTAKFDRSPFQGLVLDVSNLTDMSKTPPQFREDEARPLTEAQR